MRLTFKISLMFKRFNLPGSPSPRAALTSSVMSQASEKVLFPNQSRNVPFFPSWMRRILAMHRSNQSCRTDRKMRSTTALPLLDRVPNDKSLDKHIFLLPDPVDTIICLSLGGEVPGGIEAESGTNRFSVAILMPVRRTHLITRFASVKLSPTDPHFVLISITFGPSLRLKRLTALGLSVSIRKQYKQSGR